MLVSETADGALASVYEWLVGDAKVTPQGAGLTLTSSSYDATGTSDHVVTATRHAGS